MWFGLDIAANFIKKAGEEVSDVIVSTIKETSFATLKTMTDTVGLATSTESRQVLEGKVIPKSQRVKQFFLTEIKTLYIYINEVK